VCAINGLWQVFEDTERNLSVARDMVGRVRHRGPDADGYAHGQGWAVGHARLSIVDLSGGNQPIKTADGRVLIIGNNEIYNGPELREELIAKGHKFSTHSDTEVALHGWVEWGEAVFSKLNGMFALIIVDTRTRTCVLARDPMGIKPLHFAQVGKGFAFASEIKSLFAVPGIKQVPNWDAIHLFLNFRYVPDERTLFEGVERLPPGSYAVLSEGKMRITPYFSLNGLASAGGSYAQAKESLAEVLPRAVKRHLMADVEVGAYLSGGIDSSLVSALAVRESPKLRTFCLAFGEPTDENRYASEVAGQIRSRHEDLHIGGQPLTRYEEILWHVEEPKVNCVQGFVLAEAVAKNLKVVLSGLGGDELFAGYETNDYLYPMTKFPRLGRGLTLSPLQTLAPFPQADHYFRAAELGVNLTDPVAYYAILRNAFDHNPALMKRIYERHPKHWENLSVESLRPYYDRNNPDRLNALLCLEARTKLVNDFLLTEDRVSMAHSLEVRVPLLDKELLELAFPLPSSFKYAPGKKKKILRDVGTSWLPDKVLNRKKWGFSVNPHLLFDKQLREFAGRELTRERVGELGVFSWKWIQQVLEAPPNPRMRWHYFNLWVIAGLSIWHRTFFEENSQQRHLKNAAG